MKKIFLALVMGIVLMSSSCSKSDTASPAATVDPIVGKWKVTSSTSQIGTTGTPTNDLQPCDLNQLHTFTSTNATSGMWSYTIYSLVAGVCQPTGNSSTPIAWVNQGNNNYQIQYNGGFQTDTFVFSADKNTVVQTETTGSNIYKTTYARQN